MDSRYSDYDSGSSGSSNNERNDEIIFTPYAEVTAEIASVFGAASQYGQSLGVVFENVEVVDGCLYVDAEKDTFKLFSWKESNDMSPEERLDRGQEPSADDASPFITKKYAGNEKEYELVAARVPEVVDEDGETVIEASSKIRDVDVSENGDHTFGDWTDLGGDTIEVRDLISWYDGNDSPTISAQNLATTLTEYGDLAIEDEEDIDNWLSDTSGENILREDLEDRRVRFFTIEREGENYTYNLPIVEDAASGQRIEPDNRVGDSKEAQDAAEADADNSGPYPEPVADYIESGTSLDLTEERARNLLNDLVSDDDNALTNEMVEENGGADALVNEVV